MVKENRDEKQLEQPCFWLCNAVVLTFLFAFFEEARRNILSLSAKWNDGNLPSCTYKFVCRCGWTLLPLSRWGFFFISTRGHAVTPPPPSLFPLLSHTFPRSRSVPVSLLWESTHNALWGNCPIMNTTLLNLNAAAGRGHIGHWNIHKALITLLFLADALCALTVGDNHAVPLGCTVYGKSLTIRTVGRNRSRFYSKFIFKSDL